LYCRDAVSVGRTALLKELQEYATLPTIREGLVIVDDFAAHGGDPVLREFDFRWGLA
jgi:hypothetical protein